MGSSDASPGPRTRARPGRAGPYWGSGSRARTSVSRSGRSSSSSSAASMAPDPSTRSRTSLPPARAVRAISAARAYPRYGVRAVTTPTLRALDATRCSRFTSIPVTQCAVSDAKARLIHSMLCSRPWQMIGSKALSWSCPPSAAMVTVMSLPTTEKATWLTISGITGLTLPGMMLDPAWRGGSRSSPSPAWGPDESSRRSLQILETLTAVRLSMPETWTKLPVSEVASIRSVAETTGSPVSSREVTHHGRGVPGHRRDAGADRGRPEVDLDEQGPGIEDAGLLLGEGGGPRAELLAHRHRHGVLQLGPADLGDADGTPRPSPRRRPRARRRPQRGRRGRRAARASPRSDRRRWCSGCG